MLNKNQLVRSISERSVNILSKYDVINSCIFKDNFNNELRLSSDDFRKNFLHHSKYLVRYSIFIPFADGLRFLTSMLNSCMRSTKFFVLNCCSN